MDPRVTRTRTALMTAALQLVEEAAPSSISVAMVCERAGVSRVAFYDRFGTLDALFVAAMEEELERVRTLASTIAPRPDRGSTEPPEDLVEVFRVVGRRAALYRAMLAETGSMGFLHRLRRALGSAVAASLPRLSPPVTQWPVSESAYVDYVTGSVIGVVTGWLLDHPEDSPESVATSMWWLINHRPQALTD